MRVGVNTLFLVPGDVGGTEVYLRENLKEMIPNNPQDTFVLFVSRDNEDALKADLRDSSNVEYVQLPLRSSVRPMRIIVEQTLLPWLVKKYKTDVLWSPGYTAPLVCPCPQAVTIHDLQYKTHPDDLSFSERIATDFLVKNACKRCESIIAVSRFSKNEIVRHDFASEQKIHVVYEGVDLAFGKTSSANMPEKIALPDHTPYILCVAHTYPHKQVHLLVEAFAQMIDKIPHHLVLIGKPRRGEVKVQESLEAISDKQRIHRTGILSYDELKSIYQGADLFVLPSEYEGFGLPILEALLAGVPVVTTDKASIPEVGGNHVNYFHGKGAAALAESIIEILSIEGGTREERKIQGKDWAASFTWKKSAENTMEYLQRIR